MAISTASAATVPPTIAKPARPLLTGQAPQTIAPTLPVAPALPAAFPQRRPSPRALPPRKRYKLSDAGETGATRADETGATLADGPKTGLPPTDDETSPVE